MSKLKNDCADLEYKLGEAIKINNSLTRENGELKWEMGSTLVDLREENEQLRVQFDELKELSRKLVEYNYDSEEHDYECYEDNDKPQSHIFHTIIKIHKLIEIQ